MKLHCEFSRRVALVCMANVLCCALSFGQTVTKDGLCFLIYGDRAAVATPEDQDLESCEIPQYVECDGQQHLVDSICDNAFKDCGSLTAVAMPTTVTKWGVGLFQDCESLVSVNIPDSVTTLESTFDGCASLASVTIPNTVKSLESAFMGCASLSSVAIPSSVTSLDYAFYGCTSLSSVTVPSGVESLTWTFAGCTNLTSVTLPSTATTLDCTFYGCASLSSVTIPSAVASLVCALDECPSMSALYMLPTTVPYWEGWDTAIYSSCKVYVPQGCLDDYKSAEGWSDFYDIQEFETTGVGHAASGVDGAKAKAWYGLNGQALNAPAKGVNIVRMSDGSTRKVVVK